MMRSGNTADRFQNGGRGAVAETVRRHVAATDPCGLVVAKLKRLASGIGAGRVLLCDEAGILLGLGVVAEALGLDVSCATCADEARAAMRMDAAIDLVVIDAEDEGWSAFAAEVQATRPEMDVVLAPEAPSAHSGGTVVKLSKVSRWRSPARRMPKINAA